MTRKCDRRQMDDAVRRRGANRGGHGRGIEEIGDQFVRIGRGVLDEAEDAVAGLAQMRTQVPAGEPGGTRDQHALRTRCHDQRA